jgi:hypothetical protein
MYNLNKKVSSKTKLKQARIKSRITAKIFFLILAALQTDETASSLGVFFKRIVWFLLLKIR